MSISAKPTEKVFKSLLAVTLSVSLCPLAPAGQAQADEAENDGSEVSVSSSSANDGSEVSVSSSSANDGSETNSSPASVNDGSEASIPYASANDSDALPGDSDDGIAPERDALPGDFDDDIDPQSVDSSDPIVDWTTCGTARWTIDAGGCLTIAPMEGTDNGELEIWVLCDEVPWYNYRNSITSAKVAGKIATQTTALMFNDCPKLASLDLSGLDTSDVTNMSNMFSYCWSLTSLDLSPLDTSNVTDMRGMFSECSSLSSLDLSPLDTSNVTDMSYMFSSCSRLASLDLSSFDTSQVESMGGMFDGCSSLTSLDVSSFDTSNVTGMSRMFYGCSSLASLDVSSFDTSNVTGMSRMFYGCSSLASLDVSSFDTSGAVGMKGMFSGCSKLALLDVSSFDTSRVTDMSDVFHGCSSLSSLDVSSFDTSNVWGMKGMFNGCSELVSLDLSSFNTWLVSNLSDMFSGCSSLKSLDLSSFDTSYVLRMNGMFNGCSSLKSLDLSSFDTSRTGEMVSIFSGCLSLRTVKLGAGFTFTGRWTGRICNLPAISDLNGYTGLWVSSADGEAYKPNAIPNNVAAVYTAQQKPGVVMGDISSAIVSDIPEQTCTGSRIEPEVEVTLDGKTLVRGVDFRVSYTNNIKVGTATATIIGIGDYEGVIRKHFSIKKAPTPIFADVDYSSWYGDAVTFVAEKDLVTGYSDSGLFGVGNALTRAQLATILYRNANPDASPDFRPRNTTGMPDVEGFTWYTAGVNWAVENGVINGYADGEGNRVAFGPDDSMTLEQLVTAIANLSADEEDLPGTGETAAILRPFRDRWSVSPWARPSMAWAAQKGLVMGYDEPDGKHLRPSENISRERAVVILMRAFELGILE